MKQYVIDFRKVNKKEDAHIVIKMVLDLPYYYGENLDALNDCLGELDKNCKVYFLVYKNLFDGLDNIIAVFNNNCINYEIVECANI